MGTDEVFVVNPPFLDFSTVVSEGYSNRMNTVRVKSRIMAMKVRGHPTYPHVERLLAWKNPDRVIILEHKGHLFDWIGHLDLPLNLYYLPELNWNDKRRPYSWALNKMIIVIFIHHNIFQKPSWWVAAHQTRFTPFQHEPEKRWWIILIKMNQAAGRTITAIW